MEGADTVLTVILALLARIARRSGPASSAPAAIVFSLILISASVWAESGSRVTWTGLAIGASGGVTLVGSLLSAFPPLPFVSRATTSVLAGGAAGHRRGRGG